MNLVARDFDPRIHLGSAIAREMEVEVAEQKNPSLLMTSRGKANRLVKILSVPMGCPAVNGRHDKTAEIFVRVHGLWQTRLRPGSSRNQQEQLADLCLY